MRNPLTWPLRLAACLAVAWAWAAPPPSVVNLRVRESTGIRRFGYPASVRVPFPQSALSDAAHVRLVQNHLETPAQYNVESQWPDGSVRWLWVDFNVSMGPHEEAAYQLEYGGAVARGISPKPWPISETSEAIQVGEMRFSKTGAPLLLSVQYRAEAIGQGPNGFAIAGAAGASQNAATAEPLQFELLRSGPLYVVFRYSGRMRVGSGDPLPFTLTVELPRSKSWWKGTATVEDPAGQVREVSFHTPLALGPYPWIWDFGVGSWTYGTLQGRTDSVVLTQTVKLPRGSHWEVRTGEKGHEQPYETTGGQRPLLAEGWGHIQNQKEAVAYAVEGFGRQEGAYTIALAGDGQTAFTFASARPLTHYQFTVYQHFVAPPAAIGAATSPVSMLNPLVVSCEREQYMRSGQIPPP